MSRLEIIQKQLEELKLYREYLLKLKVINSFEKEKVKIKKLDR